jgi:hypothetical protein
MLPRPMLHVNSLLPSLARPCSLSFHIHFYRLLKWLIAGPFLVAGLVLLAFKVDMDVLPAYL